MFSRHLKAITPIFRPPFDGLIWLVVLFYGWCFLVHPDSQILRGNLPDPDDYTYLNQLNDWLGGQNWFDNTQHRLNPPDGIPIHFARITELPMAAIVAFLRMLGLAPKAAGMLMAAIYPLLLLGGLLVALRWAAQHVVPKKWAGASAYVALFATGMIFFFTPGHIDHHGLVLVILTLTLGCLLHMTQKPAEPLWGLAAGFCLALGLCVALEILPWLLLISIWVGFWAASKGGKASFSALAYGIALYLGSILFLATYRPPSQWFNFDVLAYSATYVLLTGGIAVSFAGIAVAHKQPGLRWIAGSLLALATGALFLHRFPELIKGPYGDIDPALAKMILGEVDEAQPLIASAPSFIVKTLYLGASSIAIAASAYFLHRAKDTAERWRWALILALLLTALSLVLFYQYRFMGVLGLMTVLPLTALLQRGWMRIAEMPISHRKVFAQAGLLLLVGPLPTVLYPALLDGRSFNKGIFLFPVDSSVTSNPCDTYELERILNNPRIYGDRPRLIMNVMGQGPELLFRTPHKVLAAPYHTNVEGNIDALRFFSTPYTTEAEAIARRRQVDLVVACRFVPKILTRGPDSKSDFAPHLIELLVTNKYPGWLKPVRFPSLRNFVIYEMQPDSAAQKSSPAH